MCKKYFPAIFIIGLILTCIISCSIYNTNIKSSNKAENLKGSKIIINSPTKLHLKDGSVIIAQGGFNVDNNKLNFSGQRYNLSQSFNSYQYTIEIDSVAFLEYYKEEWNVGAFFTSSVPVLSGIGLGTAVLMVAIFGSCPTIYSYDGNDYTLEAEAFSYSISKLSEGNDLDLLNRGKIINGEYILKLTNEALETHYINKMNLVVADYPSQYDAYPNNNNEIILINCETEPIKATNRLGHDISNSILKKDLVWYQTDTSLTRKLTENITNDWIDIYVNVPEGVDKIYLGMKFRNTLLNTILLYDVMLGGQGYKAIDWLEKNSSNISDVMQLHNWYQKYFGIHIKKFNGKEYVEVQRISDTGPITWHELGTAISVESGKTEHFRIEFLADNIQVDWLGYSFDGKEKYPGKYVRCSELFDSYGNNCNYKINLLNETDSNYFVTYPGNCYYMKFKVAEAENNMKRSYFISSRGFYIEWLRQNWLSQYSNQEASSFELNEESINKTAKIWLSKKISFEKEFYEKKIDVKGGRLK